MSRQAPLPHVDPLEAILRHCAEVAPEPWYPKLFAETTGTPRDSLDPPLEKLRLAGLVRLTDWVQGRGQGYALTEEGRRVLGSPRDLDRLRAGQLEPALNSAPTADGNVPRDVTTYDRGEAIREALLSPPNPRVTRALIFANLLVFGYGLFLASDLGVANKFLTSPPAVVLMKTGAIHGGNIAAGEWWRLLTCCFVHIGLLHLGVNLYSLWAVGPLVEQMWGHGRYLAIYLISGLAGSCAMVIFTPESIGAGASGALWGILGSMLAWVVLNRSALPPALFSTWMRQLITVIILNVFISYMPGISAAAHFGGGAAGVLAAAFLNFHRFGRAPWRYLALLGVIAVPLVSIGAVVRVRDSVEPPWARWRQELQFKQQREQERPQREQWQKDETNLREKVLPLTEDALQNAVKADQLAYSLLEETPQGRSNRQKQEAIDQLNAAREELGKAIEAAEAAGPYETPQVENGRQVVLQYLKARSEFCGLATKCLEERRPSLKEVPKAYEDYQKQWQQVGEWAASFRQLLH